MNFKIGNRWVGEGHPVYFIAEIGSNHDGSLERAKKLIELASQAGADCAKFQHFRADTLASKSGFEQVAKSTGLAHYKDNPYDVFKKYELPWEWTPLLKEHCDKAGIEFMSTPYDLEAVDHLDPYVNAFKIGSGDITYKEIIVKAAQTNKPIIASCGASEGIDVKHVCRWTGPDYPLCIMQCNTDYSGGLRIFKYSNLSYINELKKRTNRVIGFSDHYEAIDNPLSLAAVAMGAKIIEKHFTDRLSTSPDNSFAIDPRNFHDLVFAVHDLEIALGDGIKVVEYNEQQTVVLQRRCLRAAHFIHAGTFLHEKDVVALRPAPHDSMEPYILQEYIGKEIKRDVKPGDYIREEDFS